MDGKMEKAIQTMAEAVQAILHEKMLAFYLFGSLVLHDFKPGWSDVDFLCLTDGEVTGKQAEDLLTLRQALALANGESLYRCFEGAFVSFEEFQAGVYSKVVYWGTSGQRITSSYSFDAFSLYELLHDGVLVSGKEIRSELKPPGLGKLREAVISHLESIRKHALTTDESLYSCGWLLDIARGLYTLRTGKVIAKTAAGKWALAQGLCPDPILLVRTLEIRNNPLRYKDEPETKKWLSSLGDVVQRFADVLEREILLISASNQT